MKTKNFLFIAFALVVLSNVVACTEEKETRTLYVILDNQTNHGVSVRFWHKNPNLDKSTHLPSNSQIQLMPAASEGVAMSDVTLTRQVLFDSVDVIFDETKYLRLRRTSDYDTTHNILNLSNYKRIEGNYVYEITEREYNEATDIE